MKRILICLLLAFLLTGCDTSQLNKRENELLQKENNLQQLESDLLQTKNNL